MIPQERISQVALRNLVEYVRYEIPMALSQRHPLEEKWMRWHKAYRCVPEVELKEFPFLGASNLVTPLIATDVDTLFARIMGLLYAPDNLLSCSARRPDLLEFAPRLQEFLQAVQESELHMYPSVADWILEILKLGTGVLKTRYRREMKTIYESWGGMAPQRKVTLLDRPDVRHVPLWDFLLPPMATNIQEAPWASERILLDWQQYQARVENGIYLPSTKLQEWLANSKGSRILEQLMKLDSYEATQGTKLECWETWLDYDISAMGERNAILVTVHLPTMSILRLDYNPWLNQERPFDAARFMRQEDRFYGLGLAEMLEPMQDEATAMHNQRIDSGTIANSFMFKGKRGVIKDDEPVFPGRWFILDNMDDVDTLNMASGKYDPRLNYEESTLLYAQRRSGVNDYVMGNSAPNIGYSTAYTTMEQKQTAVMRFDQTMREIREALGNVGTKVVELYQQFNPTGKAYAIMGPEDGQILQKYLEFPPELLRKGIKIDVTATSASLNKEMAIRTDVMLMQMLNQYYQTSIQAMMIAFNPQMPPPMKEMAMMEVNGLGVLMKRILDNYDIQDIRDFLPQGMMNDALQQLGGFGGMNGNQGGGFGPAGAGNFPGMGFVPPQFGPAQTPIALLGAGAGGQPYGGFSPAG